MAEKTDNLDEQLRQWIIELRNGNQSNYKSLLESVLPFIRSNAYSLLTRFHCADMAEDIAQETLLAIHLKLPTYDINLSFLAWVRAVIKHKMIDNLRRVKGNTLSLTDMEWQEPLSRDTPDIAMAQCDLHKLLATLKPPAGEIIYALKVDGMSLKELATIHQTSESNIKVIVHRGLQKLSALIASNMKV